MAECAKFSSVRSNSLMLIFSLETDIGLCYGKVKNVIPEVTVTEK